MKRWIMQYETQISYIANRQTVRRSEGMVTNLKCKALWSADRPDDPPSGQLAVTEALMLGSVSTICSHRVVSLVSRLSLQTFAERRVVL